MFGLGKKKSISDIVDKKTNTVTELQNRIADCNDRLANAIKSDYPIGSVVGICANPNDPEFIIVGHIVDGTKEPLIQIACLNPRAANARSVSSYSYKDVHVHGYYNDIFKTEKIPC